MLPGMPIPTEPIGSIPRPAALIETITAFQNKRIGAAALEGAYAEALRDTIVRFERTGSPIITDGEQTKPSFATYPLSGLNNLAPDGGHHPVCGWTRAPVASLDRRALSIQCSRRKLPSGRPSIHQTPIKQAVISASALSLLYPSDGIPDYPREAFMEDLINEAAADIRGALDAGAATVQIDFTEARLSLKLDPSVGLLRSFIALNNQVLNRLLSRSGFV